MAHGARPGPPGSSHSCAVQSVYKTYIDVVHICKDETAKLFSTAAAADGSAAPQSAEEIAADAADPLVRGGELNEEQLAAKEAAFKVRLPV